MTAINRPLKKICYEILGYCSELYFLCNLNIIICHRSYNYSVLMIYLKNENMYHRLNGGDWFSSMSQVVSMN